LVYGFKDQPATVKPLSPLYKTRAFKTIIISIESILILIFTDRLKMRLPSEHTARGDFYGSRQNDPFSRAKTRHNRGLELRWEWQGLLCTVTGGRTLFDVCSGADVFLI
jgi:hypothetical protein